MKVYEIDFKGVKRSEELFERIIESLDFPSWCGKNLDAMWDMITTDIEIPATIYVKGIDGLPQELQSKKKGILEVFDDTGKWYEKLGMHVEIHIED